MRHSFTSSRAVFLILGLSSAIAAGAGVTGECSTGEAPAGFLGASCTPSQEGSSGPVAPVCRELAYGWECDLERNGNVHADDTGLLPSATVVTDFSGSGSPDFSAYGYADNGVPFCCTYRIDDNEIVDRVALLGTDDADTLSFRGSSRQLSTPASNGSFALQGWIEGQAGEDLIFGSDFSSSTSPYFDNLFGGDDDDTLSGFGGADWLYGGDGADDLSGGAGIDTVYGQGGDDAMTGGPGSDFLYGGDGDDAIEGGSGTDELHGEGGSDVLCDRLGGDQFHGGSGSDVLWYEDVGTTPPGPSFSGTAPKLGANLCGHAAWGTGWAGLFCQYILTTPPAACS